MQHQGTVTLETERLRLRRFTPGDAEMMYANWASDPEVTRFLTWPVHSSVDVTRQLLGYWSANYEKPDYYQWALELKDSGEVIGSISVVHMIEPLEEAEVGYCLGQRWWGRGLMPEALKQVLRYLFFEVGFNRVTAGHDIDNPKSGRVMQKAGMLREGVRRQGGRNNRGFVDMACYAILRSDMEG